MNPTFHSDCHSALAKALITVVGLPRHPKDASKFNLAKDNRDFTPTVGVPWVREACVFGGEQLKSLPSTGGLLRTNGTYFLDVFFPEGTGRGPSQLLIGAIRAVFRTNAQLRYGLQSLTVVKMSTARGLNKDGWYQTPITIAWYADDTN